jgi:hypothetical protein
MIRYICKTKEELNYIIHKLDLEYSEGNLIEVNGALDSGVTITLNNNKKYSNFCHIVCDKCNIIGCTSRAKTLIKTSHLMREEKLNRILND